MSAILSIDHSSTTNTSPSSTTEMNSCPSRADLQYPTKTWRWQAAGISITIGEKPADEWTCYHHGERLGGNWICPIPPASTAPLFVDELGQHVQDIDWREWQLHPRIVYSGNRWTRDAPTHIPSSHVVSLSDLIPTFAPLQEALVTSFAPWSPAFLIDHFPKSTHLTFICTDIEKEKNELDDVPRSASSSDQSAKSSSAPKSCWLCLHPDHVEKRTCDYCRSIINEGSNYHTCLSCADLDCCADCLPSVRKGEMTNRTSDSEHKHNPYEHLLEERVCHSSKTCDCLRKREVHWIQPPLVSGPVYSIFHAELMLLLYPSSLRVVISSFNVDQHRQWDRMTDSFWICDFPRLDEGPTVAEINNPFFDKLTQFVEAAGSIYWADKLGRLRLQLDHLPTSTTLITSIPSVYCPSEVSYVNHKSTARNLFGLPALQHALGRYPAPDDASPVFISGFSIGGAGRLWLDQFANAVGTKLNATGMRVVADKSSTYFDAEFGLRSVGSLWHVDSKDDHLYSHSKMMCRAWKYPTCDRLHGWVYIGSHNFSKASWGTMDGERNLWELGVLSISTCSAPTNAPSLGDSKKASGLELRSESTSHSSYEKRKCSCCLWDLTHMPLPFSQDRVTPLMWNQSIRVPDFNTSMPLVGSCLLLIVGEVSLLKQKRWTERVVRGIPCDRKVRSGTLASQAHERPNDGFILSENVWPDLSHASLVFPPPPNTIIFARVHIPERRVVWLERIFQPTDVDATESNIQSMRSTKTTAASSFTGKYVPPHRRRS